MSFSDLRTRALHTLWQTFLAALAVTWAASGLDVSQITDIDSAKKFAVAALAAVGAALLSAIKTTVTGLANPAGFDDDQLAAEQINAALDPAATPEGV